MRVPRLVGIEHPFGQIMGRPGDRAVQREVLWGAIAAAQAMQQAGRIKHLPIEWAGTAREANAHPPEPPPIVGYLRRHPWHVPRLLSREV